MALKATAKLKAVPKAKPKRTTIGQPPKYRDEYIPMILKYFRDAVAFQIHQSEKGTAQVIVKDNLPTMTKFARTIGVYEETMREWCGESRPEWTRAYAECKRLQQEFIIQAGMSGATPANFAIFMLKANHGMRDNTDPAPVAPPPTEFTLNVVTAESLKVERAE